MELNRILFIELIANAIKINKRSIDYFVSLMLLNFFAYFFFLPLPLKHFSLFCSIPPLLVKSVLTVSWDMDEGEKIKEERLRNFQSLNCKSFPREIFQIFSWFCSAIFAWIGLDELGNLFNELWIFYAIFIDLIF